MKLTINPGFTVNVGNAGSTGSSTITYDVDNVNPSNPQLGDFRFIPQQVINRGDRATIEWYDSDKKEWLLNTATLFDLHLAQAVSQQTDYDPQKHVYYRLVHNVNESIQLPQGATPSFATDNVTKGE